MTRKTLTPTAVDRLPRPAAGQRAEKYDAALPGFGVRVTPQGAKSWIVWFRVKGDPRRRRFTLTTPVAGTHLAAARDEARGVLALAAEGKDPGEARAASRHETGRTYAAAVDAYEAKGMAHRKASGRKDAARILRSVGWGPRALRSISRQDVMNKRNEMVASGRLATCRLVLSELSSFFDWAVTQGRVDVSPVSAIPSPFAKGQRKSRTRVLTDPELSEVWNAAKAMGGPFGALVGLLAVLMVRRSEAAAMTAPEVALDEAIWTIPTERTKTNTEPHDVPLSPLALTILSDLDKHTGGPFLLSTTNGQRPISGFSKFKAALDTRILSARKDAARGKDVEPMARWTLHDLRRTAATRLARAGVEPHVLKLLLGHAYGGAPGAINIYNRHKYLEERRAALNLWAGVLSSIVGDDVPGNVVALVRG